MNVKRNKISRAIVRIIVVLICLSLALLSLPSIPAQGTKSYESQAQLSAGVLLNKPGISYDLSILEKMSKTDSVNINQILKTEHGMSSKIIEKNIYIYRSNFNENVSVLLFEITPSELSINDTEKSSISFSGLSVNIVIPTELVYENFDQVLSPTVPIDPETFAWGAALNYELTWLENRSIIKGLTQADLDELEQLATTGQENLLSMALYENTSWAPYLIPDDLLVSNATFEQLPFQISPSDIPAKPPDEHIPSRHPTPTDEMPYSVILAVIIVLFALGTFSYSRLKRRSLLDNLNRKNIFEHIKSNPGIHFKKLLRELNFQPGAMSYHLNVLEKGEFIKSIQDGNYRRFYLYGAKSDLRIVLTTVQLRILSVVDERPGISQSKISRTIGSNRMLVNYHIKILMDAGILSLEKSGRESQCYTTNAAAYYLTG